MTTSLYYEDKTYPKKTDIEDIFIHKENSEEKKNLIDKFDDIIDNLPDDSKNFDLENFYNVKKKENQTKVYKSLDPIIYLKILLTYKKNLNFELKYKKNDIECILSEDKDNNLQTYINNEINKLNSNDHAKIATYKYNIFDELFNKIKLNKINSEYDNFINICLIDYSKNDYIEVILLTIIILLNFLKNKNDEIDELVKYKFYYFLKKFISSYNKKIIKFETTKLYYKGNKERVDNTNNINELINNLNTQIEYYKKLINFDITILINKYPQFIYDTNDSYYKKLIKDNIFPYYSQVELLFKLNKKLVQYERDEECLSNLENEAKLKNEIMVYKTTTGEGKTTIIKPLISLIQNKRNNFINPKKVVYCTNYKMKYLFEQICTEINIYDQSINYALCFKYKNQKEEENIGFIKPKIEKRKGKYKIINTSDVVKSFQSLNLILCDLKCLPYLLKSYKDNIILFYDEPTAFLDKDNRDLIKNNNFTSTLNESSKTLFNIYDNLPLITILTSATFNPSSIEELLEKNYKFKDKKDFIKKFKNNNLISSKISRISQKIFDKDGKLYLPHQNINIDNIKHLFKKITNNLFLLKMYTPDIIIQVFNLLKENLTPLEFNRYITQKNYDINTEFEDPININQDTSIKFIIYYFNIINALTDIKQKEKIIDKLRCIKIMDIQNNLYNYKDDFKKLEINSVRSDIPNPRYQSVSLVITENPLNVIKEIFEKKVDLSQNSYINYNNEFDNIKSEDDNDFDSPKYADVVNYALLLGIGVYDLDFLNKPENSNYKKFILNKLTSGETDQKLKYIISTTDISYGYNIKNLENIIIDDTCFINEENSLDNKESIYTLFQLMSRAGRIGQSYKSNIFCSPNVIQLLNNFIYNKEYKIIDDVILENVSNLIINYNVKNEYIVNKLIHNKIDQKYYNSIICIIRFEIFKLKLTKITKNIFDEIIENVINIIKKIIKPDSNIKQLINDYNNKKDIDKKIKDIEINMEKYTNFNNISIDVKNFIKEIFIEDKTDKYKIEFLYDNDLLQYIINKINILKIVLTDQNFNCIKNNIELIKKRVFEEFDLFKNIIELINYQENILNKENIFCYYIDIIMRIIPNNFIYIKSKKLDDNLNDTLRFIIKLKIIIQLVLLNNNILCLLRKKEIKLHTRWIDPYYYIDESDDEDNNSIVGRKSIDYLFELFENLIYPEKSKIIYPKKCNKELYELLITFTKILIEYYTEIYNESPKIEYYDTAIFKKSKEIVLNNIHEEITFKDYLLNLIGTIDNKIKINNSESPYLDTLLIGIDTEKIKKDQEEYEKQEKENLINSYIQKLENLGYHKNNDILQNINRIFISKFPEIKQKDYDSKQIEIALKYLTCDLNIDIKDINKDEKYIEDKLDYYLEQDYQIYEDENYYLDFWLNEDNKRDILNNKAFIKEFKENLIFKSYYCFDNINEYTDDYDKIQQDQNIYYIKKVCFVDLLLYSLLKFSNTINKIISKDQVNFCIINILINFNNSNNKSIYNNNIINIKSLIIGRLALLTVTTERYNRKPVLHLNIKAKNGLIDRFKRTLKILEINE